MLLISKVLYNLFLKAYCLAAFFLAPFKAKARKWVDGRKSVFQGLEAIKPGRIIWFHCASLGEFEQARPVIEAVKSNFPDYEIVLTFFSPSGYEVVKKNDFVKHVFYLPHDSRANALRFVITLNPTFVIFVKYEFWYHYLTVLKQLNITTILISAIFRERDVFFRWYGQLFREILQCFSHIFVQDEKSALLLTQIDVNDVTISGDTRFDRVVTIKETNKNFSLIQEFKQGKRIFIAGSTWPNDEEHIVQLIKECDGEDEIKFIIAPHELQEDQISKLIGLLKPWAIAYSKANSNNIGNCRVLVIDNIGMLAHLYKYGEMAYVGGGFNNGIHNILEAAANGLPVVFGPTYQKFNEAKELVSLKGAFAIQGFEDLKAVYQEFVADSNSYKQAAHVANSYVANRTGATTTVMAYMEHALNKA